MTADEPAENPDQKLLDEASKVYLQGVATLMWGVQVIEEQLKTYLHLSFRAIRRSTAGVLVYKWDRKGIDNWSLERLISHFEKLIDDDDLVRDLRGLRDDRNQCAHRAFVQSFDMEGDRDALSAEMTRVREIQIRVDSVVGRLLKHAMVLGQKGKPTVQ